MFWSKKQGSRCSCAGMSAGTIWWYDNFKKKYRTQVQQDTSIKYIFNFIFYVLLNIHFSYNVKLGVIIDNKENLWLLNDIYKLEYKSRIKIFINFQIHYYYLEHECSLSFVKEYLISLVFKSQLCPEFFY